MENDKRLTTLRNEMKKMYPFDPFKGILEMVSTLDKMNFEFKYTLDALSEYIKKLNAYNMGKNKEDQILKISITKEFYAFFETCAEVGTIFVQSIDFFYSRICKSAFDIINASGDKVFSNVGRPAKKLFFYMIWKGSKICYLNILAVRKLCKLYIARFIGYRTIFSSEDLTSIFDGFDTFHKEQLNLKKIEGQILNALVSLTNKGNNGRREMELIIRLYLLRLNDNFEKELAKWKTWAYITSEQVIITVEILVDVCEAYYDNYAHEINMISLLLEILCS